jgi:PTH1 family peptidyl-tRNA hydrolase
MNLSGSAVKLLVKKYKVGLSDLLIICDDLDLEFGRLRLRTAGSSAGHRGIQSIIDSLKNQEFNRLRIGIGRPKEILEASEYVLSPFKRAEKFQVQEIIETALLCCQCWVENGANKAMNIFNKRSL